MAQSLTLWGATYNNVPAIDLPKSTSGTARFTDVTDTTATASDVASGKFFYTSAGVKTAGTGSGGGGSDVQVGYSSTEAETDSSSISFSSLSGEPTAFIILRNDNVSLPSGTPYTATAVVYDGTSVHAQTLTNTSNAQASYDGSSFAKSYSSGTLTVSSSGANFKAGNYLISYTYNGTAGNIKTEDVQVGSGATSITFTGLEDEPVWWSCIFKSNFSTSSGYQRVMCVTDWDGVCGQYLDSSMHFGGPFSASYSNGSFTISSNGTNNGGYFHQPGYYQLTYAVSGDQSLQTKTVTPSTSTQNVTADTGYTALKKVVVNPIPSEYIIPTGNKAITSNGTGIDVAQYATVSVSVSGGGSASIDTKTVTASNRPTSLSFTSMKGQPMMFTLRCTASMSRSSNSTYYYVAHMRYDGTNTYGNCWRMSNGNWTNITSGYSFTYSGTTLTVSSSGTTTSSPGCFYNGSYELVYVY